ncbi:type IV pilus biogenesis protein PilM [Rossellomorea aquimaris]|uniref:type IV pilus biogenesis protein PilM n=1 Tax=Rossellomorea aquimaris TaxID=189382 RepID=UPI0007D0A479|nr:pilus assembly protein PilM [Rossellomorea aquimaris]
MGILQFLSSSQKTANLVFTDQSIRFLELKQTSPLVVQTIGERSLPYGVIKGGRIIDEQTLQYILEECVEDWKIKRKSVRFVVPDPFVVLRKVTIPLDLQEDEIEGYLFLEIGTSIHLPFEDPVFDYALLGETDHKREVLLISSYQEVVDSYKDVLVSVKLKPVVADISLLALYRLGVEQQLVNSNEHTMFLHFDEHLLTISIFHNNEPIFTRPLVLEEENEKVLNEGPLSWRNYEDAFNEIEKVMNFYRFSLNQGENAVDRALISGDHPNLKEMREHLNERLNVKVDFLHLNGIYTTNDEEVSRRFATVLGLGLKEVQYNESH